MQDLICYKQLPVWHADTLPQMFQEKHNTKVGTWAKLTVLKGALKYDELNESGEIISETVLDANHQLPLVAPQVWHKITALTDDLQCQLAFYCRAEDYFAKKYHLTPTHSEVLNAMPYLQQGHALDLGCGRGRNTLYLNLKGFEVTALDHNPDSIQFLNRIIEQEQTQRLHTGIYDINQATLTGEFDLIISTVVMMFLQRERIPHIIADMQQHTKSGGYNLIVCAMDTAEYPCPMPFSFTFKSGELKQYYQGWELIKYNENVGELHKTDAQGNRIKLQFATMLARKP
ncbi:SAM-dependent methyltransferase TehB [Muribacter muris]|uniref:SAM-dependent methyltransferase TehB n=1 Tax=Muribacter muris TaxID=67855 RepID=A0A4Y9K053_9PAST|nr:SAM-dependent methyltransferase TehB [Muribacter muris]MBF0784985.1 SAM-dependent methyltransferase TehB [Muribacter muris]MBF0827293.1 SAM-dependent methyltransferase TehB [Muribacter muris]TFV10902.1 SAM-dependent methyltransferase TehB [Muribacter muris]